MDPKPVTAKLANTSLTLAILGWGLYLGQWCFDLTLGILLAIFSGGASAVCSTVLDFIPFVLWIVGVVMGHVALRQVKRNGAPGRGRAVWGLILNYSGIFFIVLLTILVLTLLAFGIGAGVLDQILPSFSDNDGSSFLPRILLWI